MIHGWIKKQVARTQEVRAPMDQQLFKYSRISWMKNVFLVLQNVIIYGPSDGARNVAVCLYDGHRGMWLTSDCSWRTSIEKNPDITESSLYKVRPSIIWKCCCYGLSCSFLPFIHHVNVFCHVFESYMCFINFCISSRHADSCSLDSRSCCCVYWWPSWPWRYPWEQAALGKVGDTVH